MSELPSRDPGPRSRGASNPGPGSSDASTGCIGGTLVFGGSFDPPHLAHVDLARRSAAHLGCTRILVIPSANTPLRQSAANASGPVRLALTRIAFAEVLGAEVLDLEIIRTGTSYTIDTLQELRVALPAGSGPCTQGVNPWRLLIGSDQGLNFTQWRNWQEIITDFATPAIVPRPPETEATLRTALLALHGPQLGRQWASWVLPFSPIDLSSTAVRTIIASGGDTSNLLDHAVRARIDELGLYRGDLPGMTS